MEHIWSRYSCLSSWYTAYHVIASQFYHDIVCEFKKSSNATEIPCIQAMLFKFQKPTIINEALMSKPLTMYPTRQSYFPFWASTRIMCSPLNGKTSNYTILSFWHIKWLPCAPKSYLPSSTLTKYFQLLLMPISSRTSISQNREQYIGCTF